MEETLVCPICETANQPDATHCEVCGERLVPAEPGEEVGPEESVAENLSVDGGEFVGFAVEGEDEAPEAMEMDLAEADATAEGFPVADSQVSELEFEASDPELVESAESLAAASEAAEEDLDALEAPGDETGELDQFEEQLEEDRAAAAQSEGQSEDQEAPEMLYSPVDGTGYPRGSQEYEEGFGPMGEELVAEPPTAQASEASEASEEPEAASFDDEFDDEYETAGPVSETSAESVDEVPARSTREPSPEFRAAFQARQKERPSMEPLPQPGTYAEPATLTVYVNREPTMRHEIETDETLIGRRDPVADAYPDVDLTDYDPEAHVSRKHAYIYRQNKNYTLYAVSNAGTQLNSELLDLGDRRPLKDGDVIVLAGKVAMKFDLPGA